MLKLARAELTSAVDDRTERTSARRCPSPGPESRPCGDRDRDALDNLEEVDREVIDASWKIGLGRAGDGFGAVTERLSVR